MLPDSYKELSLRKGARSFLDNRLVTERRRRDFAGGGWSWCRVDFVPFTCV